MKESAKDVLVSYSVHPAWDVLAERCVSCHGPIKRRGSLRLDTLQQVELGGKGGLVVSWGKGESSLIERCEREYGSKGFMPKKDAPLRLMS